jgi:hypothetical protein
MMLQTLAYLVVLAAPAVAPRKLDFTVGTIEVTQTNTTVQFGFAGGRPSRGRMITVLPIGPVAVQPLRLKLARVEYGRGGCDGDDRPWWGGAEVLLPMLPSVHDDSMAAIVIYPAVPTARIVPVGDATPPNGVSRSAVLAAVDITGDADPELLVIEYCCLEPAKQTDECDYVCIDFYEKRNGRWVVRRHLTPC